MLRNSIGSHSFTCYSVDYHLLFLCSCRWVEGIGKRRNLIKVERRNLNSENDRVLANRESAAHSKERRTHYTMETEQKALTLQPQSIQFSVDDLAKIEKEISDMKAKNRDLECEIEAINNETKLIRERNESLRVQLSLLKEERRQRLAFKHNNFHGLVSQFSSQLTMNQVIHHQSSKAQQQQHQLGMPPSNLDQCNNGQLGSGD